MPYQAQENDENDDVMNFPKNECEKNGDPCRLNVSRAGAMHRIKSTNDERRGDECHELPKRSDHAEHLEREIGTNLGGGTQSDFYLSLSALCLPLPQHLGRYD